MGCVMKDGLGLCWNGRDDGRDGIKAMRMELWKKLQDGKMDGWKEMKGSSERGEERGEDDGCLGRCAIGRGRKQCV